MKVDPIKHKETVREFLEYLNKQNPRNKVLAAIGFYSGLRISDILKLRVKDIHNKTYISIKQQKTKNYVNIPINKELRRIVNEYCEGKDPNEYLIKSRQKNKHGYYGPITYQQAYKIIKEAGEYCCRYENIATHTLRKTFGYNLYSVRKDIGEVMIALGQKDQGSTLRYIGVTQIAVEKSIKNLSYFD